MAAAFFTSTIAGTLALRHLALPSAVRYLLAIIPLVSGALYMLALIRDMRTRMDELQIRIYMEAAGVTVCGMFVLLFSYPLFESAGIAGPLTHDTVLLLLVGLALAGYLNAARRYR